jgi:hypothetical protein
VVDVGQWHEAEADAVESSLRRESVRDVVVIKCPRCGRPAETSESDFVVKAHEALDGRVCSLTGPASAASGNANTKRALRLEAALVRKRTLQALEARTEAKRARPLLKDPSDGEIAVRRRSQRGPKITHLPSVEPPVKKRARGFWVTIVSGGGPGSGKRS